MISTRIARTAAAAALALAGTLAGAQSSAAGVLPYTQEVQKGGYWCWAATAVSIQKYHGSQIDQDRFCHVARNIPASQPCPDEGLAWPNIVKGYNATGYSAKGTQSYLPFSAVKREIDTDSPFVMGVTWTNGPSVNSQHTVVVYGYDDSYSTANPTVSYADPGPNSQRRTTVAWNDLGVRTPTSQFKWTDTIYDIRKNG
ncbi:papain-like cysteine protease family protein [Streptomyces rubiginosohelvolus]|uniref:papain-like cysteine protease family protein n=1 Tax=Streptomyces rubiginosohelvolus TaxID=67362 RepID=UPI0037F23389